MRILIGDDNLRISSQLHTFVLSFFQQMNVKPPECAIYESGDALLQHETWADIALLDAELSGVNGIQVGVKLKEHNPHIKIIILAATPDYLDEAMGLQMFRYLSKPIDNDRLFRSLKDALYQYNTDTREYPIVTADGVYVKHAEEIVCVECSQRKTIVYTTQRTYESTQTLEHWRQLLTLPCFFVTHRSYIVNMRFVSSILKDRVILKYPSNEKAAYLARRKFAEFKDAYLLYLNSING